MVIGTALSTAVSSVNIIGNIIHDLTQGYITHAGILCYIASKINISNNSISSITGDPCPGILLTAFAGKTITGVNITGNFISGYGGDSAIGVIALKGNATGNIIDVNIAGNIIEPPLAGGIPNLSASYVNGLMVCGNAFTKGTLNSVYVNNSSNISIIGNYITGIDGIKAELVNDKLSIIGNMIKTTRYGVNLTNNTDLSIIGNSINSPSGNSITTCTFINNILATKTCDPGNVLAAASTTTTITATNSQLGDYVDVSFSQPLQNMILSGFVSVDGTVTVVLFNPTAAPIDLTSGTLKVTVYR
jgi:hypothetical protein